MTWFFPLSVSTARLWKQIIGDKRLLREKAESWQCWEMRWRRISLKFYSHLAPSSPNNFSVHTALRIAIETFLLITTETSFPSPWQRVLIACRDRPHQPFSRPTSFCRLYLPLPPSLLSPYKHIFHLFSSLTVSTFSSTPCALCLIISWHSSPPFHSFVCTAGSWYCRI